MTATDPAGVKYDLRLYIAGLTPRSLLAIANLKRICETHLAGEYRIEIVDLREDPGRARRDQIVASPTLVRQRPTPGRRLIGDLSNTERVLAGLEITPRPPVQGVTEHADERPVRP
ncbi:MAG TPA: circadian clock protein KaiB [Methanoregulaceae archaeon]|nr:circadian clock protein KaiB [Methanoregulaceae archaeon]